MACTVVTAFYPIKSKFPSSTYLDWGRIFLRLEAPIVLFTEEHLVNTIMEMRENRPIKIISKRFEDLEMWVRYKNTWIEQHKMDPEGSIHTPELYAVWAQKSTFVEKAIEDNPFNTNFFFWCDFGAFRNPYVPPIVLHSFPTTRYLPHDRILLQSMSDLEESDRLLRPDGIHGECITSEWNEIRIVGGLWGGHAKGCMQWSKAYQEMLEKYIQAGRFAGKDQQVMLSAFINNPELAYVVKSNLVLIDSWFYLEYLLSAINIPIVFDSTYNNFQLSS
jgi:hypothetical protein